MREKFEALLERNSFAAIDVIKEGIEESHLDLEKLEEDILSTNKILEDLPEDITDSQRKATTEVVELLIVKREGRKKGILGNIKRAERRKLEASHILKVLQELCTHEKTTYSDTDYHHRVDNYTCDICGRDL